MDKTCRQDEGCQLLSCCSPGRGHHANHWEVALLAAQTMQAHVMHKHSHAACRSKDAQGCKTDRL